MNQICTVFSDFYSDPIQEGLTSLLTTSATRRIEFRLDQNSHPKVIRDVRSRAGELLALDFNFALLKWYRNDDAYKSGAYGFHIDPPRYRSIPLVLHTISGTADFEYIEEDGSVKLLECKPNQTIVLAPDTRHRVSEPTCESGQRLFFFLGFDTSYE